MKNADEVRAYMEAVHRTQAAFITPDGRHVLVQIDRDGDIGLVDPDSLISWIFLNRRDLDIWPLAAFHEPSTRRERTYGHHCPREGAPTGADRRRR